MRFRKRPVVVDAIQWAGTNIDEVREFTKLANVIIEDKIGSSADGNGYPQRYIKIVIITLEGAMSVSEGDWIIRGVKGEFYPCKPDIFEQTYEKVVNATLKGAAQNNPPLLYKSDITIGDAADALARLRDKGIDNPSDEEIFSEAAKGGEFDFISNKDKPQITATPPATASKSKSLKRKFNSKEGIIIGKGDDDT
jgi:hypothetical protein